MSSSPPELGLGIITYNRLAALQGCVESVRRCTTTPYRLVIADDGGDDGSSQWAREQGLIVIAGQRRGVAWNKNRALYALMEETACDPILLLEDDCWPVETSWERAWIEAGERWGHVNSAPPDELVVAGAGTPLDPCRSKDYTAQCTVTTREALRGVGYLDTRFQGWGFEHVEWTARFARYLAERWGPPDGTYPSLPCHRCGLRFMPFGSWYNAGDVQRNEHLMELIRREPIWRPPWRILEEEAILREEQAQASV
jgi:glycosyltransferase involved in cell wall biosynthesis